MPSFIGRSNFSDHSHMSYESVLAAIKKGFSRAQAQYDIAVGLICIFDRSEPFEKELEVFRFMMKHREDFVGVDIANSEAFPCKPFAAWFQEAAAAGLGLTCHAGESSNAESVRLAVEELGVTRIGHGFRAIHDDSVVSLLKDRRILLEVCPMSNYLTGSVESIEAHPIRRLMDAGVAVCLNSDDAGMFATTLVDDYDCVQQHHGFTVQEFRACNLAALEASFLPQDVKESVRQKYFSHLN